MARLSYDLPFAWRAPLETRDVVLVYLDDDSAKKLNQPLGAPWDRALHSQLVDRLTREQARLILFDIAFDAESDVQRDEALAAAISRNGHVVLGALLEVLQPLGELAQERIVPPIRSLRKAAAGWGLLAFRPLDPDRGVRQIYTGTSDVPSATWRAAEILGAPVTKAQRLQARARWINYYGPPGHYNDAGSAATFLGVSFAQAIQPEGLPEGFFKNKLVLVGGRVSAGSLGDSLDEFATA
jgi:CHASE2 domain-containing sensor protein